MTNHMSRNTTSRGRMVRGFMLALALSAGLAAPAAGQPGRALDVRPRQNLTFGTVIAGIPTTVPPTDQARAGEFRITGTRSAEVVIQFVLPGQLLDGFGRSLPLGFAPSDGGWSTDANLTSMQVFDPAAPLVARLANNNGRLYVVLGGTVSPPITAVAGTYQATITMTVSYTGN